jgi:DNA-binding NtrC family response regulator
MMDENKRVLIVEDEAPLRKLFHKRLSRKGDSVDSFATAEEALSVLRKHSFDIALVDIKLPGMDGIELLRKIKEKDRGTEVIVITGHGTIDSAISAMKLGACDYMTKPCKLNELEVVVQKAYEKKKLQDANIKLKDELRLRTHYDEVIGQSEKMHAIMRLVEKVARSNSTVLIEGETGTGKELIAYAIHQRSPRKDESFIVVHCNSFPETLLESELFGYERGAFTGAVKQKRGLVELADRGTLFIDEVGEMNAALQVKLLRFIETSRFRRLGGEQERQLNIRIIAATNRDLFKEVRAGRFREDLYYRLKVARMHLPPLREKKEDIPHLVKYFLDKSGTRKKITRSALTELRRYEWPGNVRELANVIEMGNILSSGRQIGVKDLPLSSPTRRQERIKTLAELEKEHISQTLAYFGGNKTRTAKSLGISLRNLYRKIERYEIGPPS